MHEEYLCRLLAPLGVYDLSEGTVNEAELYALGRELDRVGAYLETVERESLTATAQDEGLRRTEALFARRSAASTPQERRAAIAALVQIDGDSFTPRAIERTMRGCGIRAKAVELGGGILRIYFPDVAGVPEEFKQIEKVLLDIIPCHLQAEFYFRYLTWGECEAAGYTWADIEAAGYTWEEFQLAVEPEE